MSKERLQQEGRPREGAEVLVDLERLEVLSGDGIEAGVTELVLAPNGVYVIRDVMFEGAHPHGGYVLAVSRSPWRIAARWAEIVGRPAKGIEVEYEAALKESVEAFWSGYPPSAEVEKYRESFRRDYPNSPVIRAERAIAKAEGRDG